MRTVGSAAPLLLLAVLGPAHVDTFMPSSVISFLNTVTQSGPGEHCLLDAQCSWSGNVICAQNGRCECATGSWDGAHCVAFDDPLDGGGADAEESYAGSGEGPLAIPERTECSSLEVKKNGKCYVRKKPGETCDFSEQCMNIGDVQYYCIANICQEAPECPPGYIAMGAECLPYSVTGGPCIHPSQCLTGSVCIKGKCRGPCDFNQVFLDEACVDYEGAGCVAISCISNKCPRAFPSCNYISQQKDYLCCDRSMETKVQCPLPNSEPQRDKETGAVVECMHRPCTANYRCVFASYGRGKYICCSKPKVKPKEEVEETEDPDEFDPYTSEKTSTKTPWVPPPPRPVDTPWTPPPQPIENTNNNNYWNGNNNYGQWSQWNNNWANWNGNWGNARNWANQNWMGNGQNNNNQNYNQWNNNYNYNRNWPYGMRRRKIRPQSARNRVKTTPLPQVRPKMGGHLRTWGSSRSRTVRPSSMRPIPRRRPLGAMPFHFYHPGHEDMQNDTLIPQLVSSLAQQLGLPDHDHSKSWSHAIRVLVYWCCTNKPCVYRDRLAGFCRQIMDPTLYDGHMGGKLAEADDFDADAESPRHAGADAPSSRAIASSFPISIAN